MKTLLEAITGILHWLIGEKTVDNDKHRELKMSGGMGVLVSTILFGMYMWKKHGLITILYSIMFLMVLRLIIVYRVYLLRAIKWILLLPAKYMTWAGGYDWQTVKTLNRGQTIKAIAVGCLVHIPVLWGIGAITFTLSDGLKVQAPASVVGTILWGTIILFLERGLIISLRRKRKLVPAVVIPAHTKNKWSWKKGYIKVQVPERAYPESEKWAMNYWGLIPRILLAISVAYFDSLPLELRYFQSEIKQELVAQKEDEFERLDSIANAQIDAKQTLIDAKRKKIEDGQKILNDEMNGVPGVSQGAGYGPNAKRKDAELNEMKTEYQNEKSSIEKDIDSIKVKYNRKKESWSKAQSEGIGAQYEALQAAGKKKPIIAWWEWVLKCVSLFLQLVPAIIKLILPVDSYERVLAKQEEEEANEMSLAMAQSREKLLKAEEAIKDDQDKRRIESNQVFEEMKIMLNAKTDKASQEAAIINATAVQKLEATKEALKNLKTPALEMRMTDIENMSLIIIKLQERAKEMDENDPLKKVMDIKIQQGLTYLETLEIA
jgi:Domain of unknown function (DUF4407)